MVRFWWLHGNQLPPHSCLAPPLQQCPWWRSRTQDCLQNKTDEKPTARWRIYEKGLSVELPAPIGTIRVNMSSSPSGWYFFIVDVCSFFSDIHFHCEVHTWFLCGPSTKHFRVKTSFACHVHIVVDITTVAFLQINSSSKLNMYSKSTIKKAGIFRCIKADTGANLEIGTCRHNKCLIKAFPFP